ncbi:TIGR03619 family F420-dependent LLM class oxidoreductase, partial [Ilumatobacter sp.]|uniref:TIGR03619 family F420-dependent LLM class oxidoreductase n=1 Tax=Ilumatobacter sp. TaxID=1967498 RepID=UPI003C37A938
MATAARVGISLMSGDSGISPVELAVAVEERGFESLWLPEHSHIPVSRDTPWPGSLSGEPLPDVYSRLLDATVALAMAAAVTTRLRLGTSVLLLAARDPLWTAKEYATLDALSGGRVEMGVGFGWNREELANHGVDFPARWDHTRESANAIRAIWSDDVAEFDGEHVSFTPSWAWPKPAAAAGPKMHIGGGAGPRLLGHVAEWADGWLPISSRPSLAKRLSLLDEACDRAARDRSEIEVSVFG